MKEALSKALLSDLYKTARSMTDPRYKSRSPSDIARTICTTLGITREMVDAIRPVTQIATGPGDGATLVAYLHQSADALTALLDLAEGDT